MKKQSTAARVLQILGYTGQSTKAIEIKRAQARYRRLFGGYSPESLVEYLSINKLTTAK